MLCIIYDDTGTIFRTQVSLRGCPWGLSLLAGNIEDGCTETSLEGKTEKNSVHQKYNLLIKIFKTIILGWIS